MKYLTIFFCLVVLTLFCQTSAYFGMPGGLSKANVKDVKQYQPLIESNYNQLTKEENYGQVVKIESAEVQVVAGTRYVIKFTLSKTDCKKHEIKNGLKAIKDCNQTHVSLKLFSIYLII